MGRHFINDLYYGRVTPWERKRAKSLAYAELEQKIAGERQKFTKGLSEEALRDFEKLEDLYSTQQEQDRIESFRQGMQIGALFMEEVCRKEDTIIPF